MNDQIENLAKIKDRIAKLLAMAADSSSPNEAAIAATRARKLMDKHQLDLLDIEGSIPEDFGVKDATRAYAAFPYHLDVLSCAVAKYNDVQSMFEWAEVTYRQGGKGKNGSSAKTRGKKIIFKGYKSDIDLATDMYDFLTTSIDRLCKEYLKDKGYVKYPVGVGKAFKVSATLEIANRLTAMTVERDRLTSSSDGRSLVISKKTAVDAYFGGSVEYIDKATKIADTADNYAASVAGRMAGKSIEIVKTVEFE